MPGGVDFPHGYISINSGTNECILGVGAVGSSGVGEGGGWINDAFHH